MSKKLKILLSLIILSIVNIINIAYAIIGSELYTPKVEVSSKYISDIERSNLIKMEFDNILRKITGKNFSLPLEMAEKYVVRYEYLEDYPDDKQLILKIYFDKSLIHKNLSDNQHTILNENRPSTLIWIKVDEISWLEVINKFLDAIVVIGHDYGLKIIHPTLDLTEIQVLEEYIEQEKLADQNLGREQNLKFIKEFSKKYSVDEIILADCKVNESNFLINWKSIINKLEFKKQQVNCKHRSFDYEKLANNLHIKSDIAEFNIQANLFIEDLFKHFINLQLNEAKKLTKQFISLKINNITNLYDYVKVEKLLQELPIIKSVHAADIANDIVEFKVLATGGKKAIIKALANNKMLRYSKDNKDNNKDNNSPKRYYNNDRSIENNLAGNHLAGNLSGNNLAGNNSSGNNLVGDNLSSNVLADKILTANHLASNNLVDDHLAENNLSGNVLGSDNLSGNDLGTANLLDNNFTGNNLGSNNLVDNNLNDSLVDTQYLTYIFQYS